MITKIFSVYDSKMKIFGQPFMCPQIGGAERGFADAVNDPKSDFSKHPEDYCLYYIADYDEETGVYTPIDHVSLGLASRFVRES